VRRDRSRRLRRPRRQFRRKGVFGHQLSVDDSIVRVPLFVCDPTGLLDPGSVSEPVSLTDIYPTIAELTGVPAPETNAVSLSDTNRDCAYTYYDATDVDHLLDAIAQLDITLADLPPLKQYAVWRSPEDKAVWYPDVDKWDGPSATDDSLRSKLKEHTERLSPVRSNSGEQVSDAVADRLEDMGYLR